VYREGGGRLTLHLPILPYTSSQPYVN
jgi:hypothetical protein